MKIKDSPPGSPARPELIPTDLSQLSHRLSGQYRIQAHSLDIWRILTCGYGFCRTGWTHGIDLRIRCTMLVVCAEPSVPRGQFLTLAGLRRGQAESA
jgi:hypothetical protein